LRVKGQERRVVIISTIYGQNKVAPAIFTTRAHKQQAKQESSRIVLSAGGMMCTTLGVFRDMGACLSFLCLMQIAPLAQIAKWPMDTRDDFGGSTLKYYFFLPYKKVTNLKISVACFYQARKYFLGFLCYSECSVDQRLLHNQGCCSYVAPDADFSLSRRPESAPVTSLDLNKKSCGCPKKEHRLNCGAAHLMSYPFTNPLRQRLCTLTHQLKLKPVIQTLL
jgi:hypothetical protein